MTSLFDEELTPLCKTPSTSAPHRDTSTPLSRRQLRENPEYKVDKVLVISTSHMPHSAALPADLHAGEYGEGYWVYAYEEDPSGWASREIEPHVWWWLGPICIYARDVLGCDWIRFDSDGGRLFNFPTYNW